MEEGHEETTAGEDGSSEQNSEQRTLFSSDVKDLLMKDLLSCDFLWSLFVAAARSYRFNSIFHPFPPQYHTDSSNEKDIIAVRDVITRIPKFTSNPDFIPDDCKQLLSWILRPNNFRLKMRERDSCFQNIKSLTGQVMAAAEPNFIFEVVHNAERKEKFKQLQGSRKTFFAYHGSRIENFYSILHNGLNTHLNKVSLFGEGTYLSSELSLCLMYSPAGEGWKRSNLGGKLSCVSVCQMIDDPSIKCQVKEGTKGEQKERARASRITDAVPEKYYVVQNNDMIQVKYLLVYKHENTVQEVTKMESSPSSSSSSYTWLRDHKFSLLMLAYVLLLIAIGLANSRLTLANISKFFKSIL